MRQALYLFITIAVLIGLTSCTGDEWPALQNRVISGVALKLDGTPFSSTAKVLATDAKGRTARSKVKSDGTFRVEISAKDFFSNNSSNGVDGNTFLQISDDLESIELIIPKEQSQLNVNLVTAVATQLFLKRTDINLVDIFNEVEVSLANDSRDDGQIVNETTLANLSLIAELNKEEFKEASQLVVGAMFGYDSSGNTAVGVDNFLTGSKSSKEITLLKAAAVVTANIFSATITAVNNSENASFLLNNAFFYEEVGRELADADGKASSTAFARFLGTVIESIDVQVSLSAIATELNAYVLDVEEGKDSFEVVIPTISLPVQPIVLTVSRSETDKVSFSVEGSELNDTTNVSLYLQTSTERKALIEIPFVFDGTNLSIGTNLISVTVDGNILATIKNTVSISNGVLNLEALLAEVRLAVQAENESNLENVPSTSATYDLVVYCGPMIRTDIKVPTYMDISSATVSYPSGVKLSYIPSVD